LNDVARPLKRARGALLRLVLHRGVAAALGAALLAPAAWIWMTESRWESAFTDGAALIAGATGAALLLTAVSGRRGDWVE
jgi:hypothetical protein